MLIFSVKNVSQKQNNGLCAKNSSIFQYFIVEKIYFLNVNGFQGIFAVFAEATL